VSGVRAELEALAKGMTDRDALASCRWGEIAE